VEKEYLSGLVPDVVRCRSVNGIFGDIGGVIAHAFENSASLKWLR